MSWFNVIQRNTNQLFICVVQIIDLHLCRDKYLLNILGMKYISNIRDKPKQKQEIPCFRP